MLETSRLGAAGGEECPYVINGHGGRRLSLIKEQHSLGSSEPPALVRALGWDRRALQTLAFPQSSSGPGLRIHSPGQTRSLLARPGQLPFGNRLLGLLSTVRMVPEGKRCVTKRIVSQVSYVRVQQGLYIG